MRSRGGGRLDNDYKMAVQASVAATQRLETTRLGPTRPEVRRRSHAAGLPLASLHDQLDSCYKPHDGDVADTWILHAFLRQDARASPRYNAKMSAAEIAEAAKAAALRAEIVELEQQLQAAAATPAPSES